MKSLKKDNKGFSLVELIVVVAIMAVLMGILVPTLVKNVEKSKKQKDLSGIEEVRATMEKVLADENFSSIDTTLTYSNGNIAITTTATSENVADTASDADIIEAFKYAVKDQVADYKCKSKTYKSATISYRIVNETVTSTISTGSGQE